MERQYSRVYVKSGWTDSWQQANHLEPISADLTAMPAIGMARFRARYGEGFWEDGSAMLNGKRIRELGLFYIQIMIADDADFRTAEILWTGFVPVKQFDVLGNKPTETVDIEIVAYDLVKLLDTPLDGAYVLPVDGTTAVEIDSMPTFNKRYGNEGTVQGNRSSRKYKTDFSGRKKSYIFSNEGEVWTNADILEYLLNNHQPATGPTFSTTYLQQYYPDIYEMLGEIKMVYDFNGATLLEAMNMLMPRSRGIAWWINCLLSDEVELIAVSLLDEEITIGKGSDKITIPKNAFPVKAEIWDYPTDKKVVITEDSRGKADKITVRGAKMKVCFTACIEDGSLEKAWTSTLETAYKNAAKNMAGYDDLDADEQAIANDRFRGADKFRRVYTSFRLPRTFNWTITGNKLIPKIDPETGELDFNKNAEYWNVGKRILNRLPFRTGIDYSGEEEDDENPENSEPEYRPILAIVKDADGKCYNAEKFGTELSLLSATVRPMQHEMGVEIKFSPAYLAAKNHFSEAEPARFDIESDDEITACDWEDHLVTIFIETDQHVKLEHNISAASEISEHIIIELPAAELWYVAPETIIDIDEAGNAVTYNDSNGGIIRDDTDLLRAVLAAAINWYSKTRYKATIVSGKLGADVSIGQMLLEIDPTGKDLKAGSVITHLSWDFVNTQTTVETDFAELNLAGIAAGRRRTPAAITGGPDIGKKVNHLTNEIEKIKEQLGTSPQRVEIPPSFKGGNEIRRAQCTENAPNGAVIFAKLYNNQGILENEPIEVWCNISGGTALNNAVRLLESGDEINVWEETYNNGGTPAKHWKALEGFNASREC